MNDTAQAPSEHARAVSLEKSLRECISQLLRLRDRCCELNAANDDSGRRDIDREIVRASNLISAIAKVPACDIETAAVKQRSALALLRLTGCISIREAADPWSDGILACMNSVARFLDGAAAADRRRAS